MPDSQLAHPLVIRRWDEAHLGVLMSAIESSIDELRLWMPWAAQGVPSRESERAVIRDAIVSFDSGADWQYSLFEAVGDALVGGCGLHRTSTDGCAEIGYWVRSDRSGQGYATAAANCLTSAAFAALPELNTVQIRMDRANAASARVPEKLGYRLVGTELREVLADGHTGLGQMWTVDREDWLIGRT